MTIDGWRPFFLVDRVTLDASGNGISTLSTGSGEEFEGESIDFIVSAGTFNIIQMKDSGGNGFTDANSSNPLPGAFFLTTLDQRIKNGVFAVPLTLKPSGIFTVEFSGGNASATIDVVIKGKKQASTG